MEMVTYGGTSSHLMVKFNDLTKQFMRRLIPPNNSQINWACVWMQQHLLWMILLENWRMLPPSMNIGWHVSTFAKVMVTHGQQYKGGGSVIVEMRRLSKLVAVFALLNARMRTTLTKFV